MVHCGVSCLADSLVLEQRGHDCGYKKCDVNGCIPAEETAANAQPKSTEVDIHLLGERMNQAFKEGRVKLKTVISEDAGR